MKHQFDLNKPAHHIANDVMRKLEAIAHESGVEIAFGVKSHNVIARLVQQYQEALENERALNRHLTNDGERLQEESRNNMLAESQQQEKDDDAIEAKLRQMLAAARFPEVGDVYVSTGYSAYVTFEKSLSHQHEVFSAATLNLKIERSDMIRNRYRVTFIAPDQEEA